MPIDQHFAFDGVAFAFTTIEPALLFLGPFHRGLGRIDHHQP
jgi:hypothetical protein